MVVCVDDSSYQPRGFGYSAEKSLCRLVSFVDGTWAVLRSDAIDTNNLEGSNASLDRASDR